MSTIFQQDFSIEKFSGHSLEKPAKLSYLSLCQSENNSSTPNGSALKGKKNDVSMSLLSAAKASSKSTSAFPLLLRQLEVEHQRELQDSKKVLEVEIKDLQKQLEDQKALRPSRFGARERGNLPSGSHTLESFGTSYGEESFSTPRDAQSGSSGARPSELLAEPKGQSSDEGKVQKSPKRATLVIGETERPQTERPQLQTKFSSKASLQSHFGGKGTVQHKKHVLYNYLAGKLNEHQGDTNSRGSIASKAKKTLMGIDIYLQGDQMSCLRQTAVKIVSHPRFETFSVFMILTNTFFIAALTQHEAANIGESPPTFYEVASRSFTVWFLLELTFRFVAAGLYDFFCGKSFAWNLFDFLIVASDMVQLFLEVAISDYETSSQSSTTFRILRILRVARALRVFRLVAFLKEFRLMVLSVLQSGRVLIWSALFLLMVMFVFAIFLTQNVTAHIRNDGIKTSDDSKLQHHFGSLETALYTLFCSISSGVSWMEVADPLFSLEPALGLVFVFYIFFAVFSMLNIITAIFVDTVISSAQNDHEEVVQAQLQEYETSLKQLADIFWTASAHNGGDIESKVISMSDFEEHLQNPKVVAHLTDIGIPVHEARAMFKLIDADADGEVTLDEFVFGCLRIKGAAKTIDLQMLIYENRRMMETWNNYFKLIITEINSSKSLQMSMDARVISALQSQYLNLHASFPGYDEENCSI